MSGTLERRRRQNWEQGLPDSLFPRFQLCYSIPVLRKVAVPGSMTWQQWILTAPLAKHLLTKQAKCHLLLSAQSRSCSCRRTSCGVIPASPSHCLPTHLRASIDEEHCGILLPRLQVVGFVHHSIQCEPRGAFKGEHFRGNVIRKRTCHGREQRAWF